MKMVLVALHDTELDTYSEPMSFENFELACKYIERQFREMMNDGMQISNEQLWNTWIVEIGSYDTADGVLVPVGDDSRCYGLNYIVRDWNGNKAVEENGEKD